MLNILFSALSLNDQITSIDTSHEMYVRCIGQTFNACTEINPEVGLAFGFGAACTVGLLLVVCIRKAFPVHPRLVNSLIIILATGPLLALLTAWMCVTFQWPGWLCESLIITQLIVFPVIAVVYSVALRKKKLDQVLKKFSSILGIACVLSYVTFAILYLLR